MRDLKLIEMVAQFRLLNVQMEAIKLYKIGLNPGYIGKLFLVIQLRTVFTENTHFLGNEVPLWAKTGISQKVFY